MSALYLFTTLLWSLLRPQGSDIDDEDMNEILKDTRLLKKLKKGRISEEDFEKQITKPKHKTEGPSHDGSDGEDVWCPSSIKHKKPHLFTFLVMCVFFLNVFIWELWGTVINKAWWVRRWQPTGSGLPGQWRGGWWGREVCNQSSDVLLTGSGQSSEYLLCTVEEKM